MARFGDVRLDACLCARRLVRLTLLLLLASSPLVARRSLLALAHCARTAAILLLLLASSPLVEALAARTRPLLALASSADGPAALVEALFGSESSAQAFSRKAKSEREVSARFASNRNVELTYGEFDLPFFIALLRDAAPQPGEAFLDVGSGCGRLVLTAALLFPYLSRASGVELLQHLHQSAVAAHAKLAAVLEEEEASGAPAVAPCHFVCGEADEELPRLLAPSTQLHAQLPSCVFVYATCWPGTGPFLPSLSATLARNLPVGSRVVTVDKQLVDEPSLWRFEEIGRREQSNYDTHRSTGWVYRLAWVAGEPGERESSDRGPLQLLD